MMTFNIDKLNTLINLDCQQRESILNLNASENHMSLQARNALTFPAYDCYEFPPNGGHIDGPWKFSGPTINESIVDYIAQQCKQLFGTGEIDVRARGGQAAEVAVLLAIAKQGCHVFFVDENSGGHFGLTHIGQRCGINLCPIVFDKETHQIDIGMTFEKMHDVWDPNSVKLITVNQSFILQQQDWLQIISSFKTEFPDMIISCDASHLLGLIAGNKITNPLDAGIDILHGSTHKTLPGPQKAMILFSQRLDPAIKANISQCISPMLQSSCGTAEIIALAITLLEMQIHGNAYAELVCHHGLTLARALSKELNVVGKSFGYTQTHQCWISMNSEMAAWKASSILHEAGLRTLPTWLPFIDSWGIRLGSNALTRRGLNERHFEEIAQWISDLLREKVSVKSIREKVFHLAEQHPLSKLHFTLDTL